MRIFLFIFFLNFSAFSQSKQVLQKELDSLKSLHSQLTANLNALQKKIEATQTRLEIATANEPVSDFKPVRFTLKSAVLFRDNNGDLIDYLYPGAVIDVIGYSDGKAKTIHKDKSGYIRAIELDEYEVYKQIIPLRDKENVIRDAKEAEETSKEEKLAKEAEKKIVDKFKSLGSPLILAKVSISDNALGIPVVSLIVGNISDKIIDGYEISITCYDNYDRPVNHSIMGGNKFKGIAQDVIEIDKGHASGWTLSGHGNTTKFTLSLLSVHFKNGKTWVPTKPVTIKGSKGE